MPFQSEKQRRYMHANLPEIAQRWERDYAGGGISRLGYQYGNTVTPFPPQSMENNIFENAAKMKPDALNIMMQGFQGGPNIQEGFGEYDKWGNIRMGLENPDEDPYQSPQGLAFLKNKLGDMWGGAKDKFGEMWGGAKDIGAQTFEGIKNIGSSAGQMAIGPLSWLAGKMDKFDQLPMADQMFISQQMGGAGQMGAGVYRDPQSGAIRDLGGKNVRSMFGNYSDAVNTEFDRYDKAIETSKDRYIKEYGSLDTESEYGKTWAEMNKRNLQMHKYYRDKKQGQQKLAADYGRAQQKKEQEAAAAKGPTRVTPQHHRDVSTGQGQGDYQAPTIRTAPKSWDVSSGMGPGGRHYAQGGIVNLWQR